MAKKREVEWDGRLYKVKSDKIDIPDLRAMPMFEALVWLNRNAFPRGYSKSTNPLAGFGDAITIKSK